MELDMRWRMKLAFALRLGTMERKSLRAMTMMALAEWCLQNSPPLGKPAKVEPKVVKP
jgi:hypothetical protein